MDAHQYQMIRGSFLDGHLPADVHVEWHTGANALRYGYAILRHCGRDYVLVRAGVSAPRVEPWILSRGDDSASLLYPAATVTGRWGAKVSNSKKYFYYFPIKARSFGIGPGLDLLMRH